MLLTLGVLLSLQQAVPDSTCATPAICDVVDRAAAANRLPGRLASYTAKVELEAAVISVKQQFVDGPTAVQQVETDVRWERGGPFYQRGVGTRSRFTEVPLTGMRYLLIGWITPITYGDRFAVFGKQSGVDAAEAGPSDVDPDFVYAVHPFASDRARYYRFIAMDTVKVVFPDSTRTVLRVRVVLSRMPTDRHLLVDGYVDVDPVTFQTAAIRGKLISTGEPYRAMSMFGAVHIPSPYYFELVNTPDSSGVWLPATQRFEWQGRPMGIEGAARALRITSHFRDRLATNSAADGAPFNDEPTFSLSAVPHDSMRKFQAYSEPLGQETAQFHTSDFFDLDEHRPVLVGESRVVLLHPTYDEDLVRFNRVEGIYAGVPVTFIPGNKARNTFLHLNGGVAMWTGDIKFDAAAGWDDGTNRFQVKGGRYLGVTNKFRNQFDNPALGALFSRDNWDYVDRYSATARMIHRLSKVRGSRLVVEAGWTEDRPLARVLDTDPWVGYLRPNRGIYSGEYFRTTATLDINPDISALFVRQGWGFQVQYDGGVGDLNYNRIQARVTGRKDFSRAYVVGVVQAGTTLGDSIPPQQLFEVGGAVQLPGYTYKQYAGNRGVVGRVRLTVPINVFMLGMGPLNKALSIPRSLPSVSFGYQGAWVDISNPGAQAAVSALGYLFDDSTGQIVVDSTTGQPLPASTASGGWKSSVDVRVGFFGGALAVGVAKPFVEGKGLSFFLSVGGQF